MDERSLANVIFDKMKQCLDKRAYYMTISGQLPGDNPKNETPDEMSQHVQELLPENSDKNCSFVSSLEKGEFIIVLGEDGVFRVYENEAKYEANQPLVSPPTLRDYYVDLEFLQD